MKRLLHPQALRSLGLALEVATSLLVARRLGLVVLGQYSTCLVVATFIFLIADAGQRDAVLRDLSQSQSALTFRQATRQRRFKALVGAVMAVVFLISLGELSASVAILVSGLLLEQRWAMFACHKNRLTAVTFLAKPAAVLVVVFAGGHDSVLAFSLATSAGFAVVHAVDTRIARGLTGRDSNYRSVAADSNWWLTGAALTAQLYVTGDYVILVSLAGSRQVGIYALAYRPTQAGLVLLSFLRDQWLRDKASDSPRRNTRESQIVIRGVGVSAGIAGVLVGSRFLSRLSGAPAIELDLCAGLLMMSLPLIIWATLAHADLLAHRCYRAALFPVLAAAVISLTGNIVLDRHLGAVGAALANLLAEATALGLFLRARRALRGQWAARVGPVRSPEPARRSPGAADNALLRQVGDLGTADEARLDG